MRLLLLSNSVNPGGGYLEWPREYLADFLDGIRNLLFVPFAGVRGSWDDYAARVGDALAPLGVEVKPIHRAVDPTGAVAGAEAIAVGGGNTLHLMKQLYDRGLLDPIRERVMAGAPYVGWSAGSNIACPTIATTNDMPIVEVPSFRALGLVSFQINPHYTDARLANHGGETRPERIAEFLEVNRDARVVGLPEGTLIRVERGEAQLLGGAAATVFEHGREVVEWRVGARCSVLDVGVRNIDSVDPGSEASR